MLVAPRPAAAALTAAAHVPPTAKLRRPRREVLARAIEKTPLQHGEKSYERLVAEAFDGPVLRLTNKIKLLEEADTRKIRRGDALDLIDAIRRELEAKHCVYKPGRVGTFLRQYAVFAACYAMIALIWCALL
jgi:hypothetical protein